jgi:replicative DNA helicase
MNVFKPINIEIERGVLNTVFYSDEAALFVAKLPAEIFANRKHRALHAAIHDVVNSGDDLTVETLRRALIKAHWWDDDENGNGESLTMNFLFDVMNDSAAPMPAQVKTHASFLRDAYRQRHILCRAQDILNKAGKDFLTREDLDKLEDEFQQAAFHTTASDLTGLGGLKPAYQIVAEEIDFIGDRVSSGKPPGILTGFSQLDKATGGLQPAELTIVCGRPGHGKSALALDIAVHAARQVPTAIFSLEMSNPEIARRLLAKKVSVNIQTLRSGAPTANHFSKFSDYLGEIGDCPLFVDDSSNISPGRVKARCREAAVKKGTRIGLIIVDYLQLMRIPGKFQSREREVATLSRDMKLLSKDLGATIIILSQLNRQVENRTNKRPLLSDLRESGAVEQDADRALAVHQPHFYSEEADPRKAEIIVLKQRSGATGIIPLDWDAPTATFHDPL